VSLDRGKYTWRHNGIINYNVKNIDNNKFKVYSGLPCQIAGNGTIPLEACVTSENPDLVIIDHKRKNNGYL
jgi:hypothetical protein